MNVLFIIKPYEIEVYSEEVADGQSKKTLLGKEPITRIDQEPDSDYENRMLFVCKELAQDAKKHIHNISSIEVILCYPWCTYEHVDIHKVFDTDTLITERLIESLKLQKKNEDILLLESEHSHVLLNGYSVKKPLKQKAREIEMQVLNVYTKASFGHALKNTFESVFHIHHVKISSIYAYALRVRPKNGLFVTIEEESVDIAYVKEGKVDLHVFIPNSYHYLQTTIMTSIGADEKTVRDILISRSNFTTLDKDKKTLKHIWPDLRQDIRQTIDQIVADHYAIVMKYVYTLIDSVKHNAVLSEEEVRICSLNNTLAGVYGLPLGKLIQEDVYIKNTLGISDDSIFIDYLF